MLCAWGITLEGRKVLLRLALGSRESYEDWLGFGRDLVARGMRAPALVVADGAPGIWKAVRELWRAAERQRCTVHALRNLTSKLPERHHNEVKARYWQIPGRRRLGRRGEDGAAREPVEARHPDGKGTRLTGANGYRGSAATATARSTSWQRSEAATGPHDSPVALSLFSIEDPEPPPAGALSGPVHAGLLFSLKASDSLCGQRQPAAGTLEACRDAIKK